MIEQRRSTDPEFEAARAHILALIERMDRRQLVIERLVWIASGGVAVLAAIGTIMVSMLFSTVSKVESLAIVQATTIGEWRAREVYNKQRETEFQSQLEKLRERLK